MKKIICLLLSVLCIVPLVACDVQGGGGGSREKVELIIWEDAENAEMVKGLADSFARDMRSKYPDAPIVTFKILPHSEKSAVEDLVLDAPAGNGPDVFAFVHDTLGTAVGSSAIAENVYAEKTILQHDSGAVESASLGGKLYGYPITAESQVLLYNTKKLTATDVQTIEGITAKGKINWEISDGYYGFGLLTDANLYGANGETESELKFDNEESIANLSYILGTSAVKSNIENDATDTEGMAAFVMGEVNAIITAPFNYAVAKLSLGNDLGIAVLPTVNGVTLKPMSGYKLYGVSRYSKEPMLAHALADYLVNATSQKARLDQKNLLPTNNDASLATAVAGNAIANVFSQSLANSRTMPKITKFAGYWVAYKNGVESVWKRESSTDAQIATALDNIARGMKGQSLNSI